jgi:N-acetylmuramoyl-L-alanine amidase
VLIESAFLSNDAEARRVATPAFQQEIAAAMLAGINDYAAALDALRPPAPPHP